METNAYHQTQPMDSWHSTEGPNNFCCCAIAKARHELRGGGILNEALQPRPHVDLAFDRSKMSWVRLVPKKNCLQIWHWVFPQSWVTWPQTKMKTPRSLPGFGLMPCHRPRLLRLHVAAVPVAFTARWLAWWKAERCAGEVGSSIHIHTIP